MGHVSSAVRQRGGEVREAVDADPPQRVARSARRSSALQRLRQANLGRTEGLDPPAASDLQVDGGGVAAPLVPLFAGRRLAGGLRRRGGRGRGRGRHCEVDLDLWLRMAGEKRRSDALLVERPANVGADQLTATGPFFWVPVRVSPVHLAL